MEGIFLFENIRKNYILRNQNVAFNLAGIAGFEPANAGVKVLCLNRLGYIPVCLFACMSIQQSGRFVKSGFACAVRRICPPRCGIAAYRRAAKPTESAASPPGTRLQWRTGEAPCGAVVLQCAAARSLAQMSRDSKVKMRALRGERLEKRKIKSRARRPLPFTHTAAAPQSASGRGAAAGRKVERGSGVVGYAVCVIFYVVYGRRPANWRYFADKIRHKFQKWDF